MVSFLRPHCELSRMMVSRNRSPIQVWNSSITVWNNSAIQLGHHGSLADVVSATWAFKLVKSENSPRSYRCLDETPKLALWRSHHWLVVWLPSILLSQYWEFHHPNWRTHIFQRGGPGPPTRFWGHLFSAYRCFLAPPYFSHKSTIRAAHQLRRKHHLGSSQDPSAQMTKSLVRCLHLKTHSHLKSKPVFLLFGSPMYLRKLHMWVYVYIHIRHWDFRATQFYPGN